MQVPKEMAPALKESSEARDDSCPSSSNLQPVGLSHGVSHHGSGEGYPGRRKLSRHESCDSYSDGKPAVDMLKDFKDPDYLAAMECDLGSSEEHDSPLAARFREEERDTWDRKGLFGMGMSSTSSASDLYKATEDAISVGEGVETDKHSIKSGIEAAADAFVEFGGETKKDSSSVGASDSSSIGAGGSAGERNSLSEVTFLSYIFTHANELSFRHSY